MATQSSEAEEMLPAIGMSPRQCRSNDELGPPRQLRESRSPVEVHEVLGTQPNSSICLEPSQHLRTTYIELL